LDFGLTETQELFRSSAREFLEARESIALARKSHSDPDAHKALWREVSALGWPGLIVEDQYGGSGLGFDDLCILLEECSAALMPGPLFETTVLGASMLGDSNSDELKNALLPKIADGTATLTLAHLEAAGRWDNGVTTVAEPGNSGRWRITGEKRFVPAGAIASHLVISATSPGGDVMLFVLPVDADGIKVKPMRLASGEAYASVELHGVEAGEDALLGHPSDSGRIVSDTLSLAAAARSSQMAGAAGAVVRRTTKYVSGRKQFGRPIGSFQAIQHRLADMATMVRGSRHLARAAAWRITSGEDSTIAVARAKSFASEHLPGVCWAAHQSHGAIGFTWEHDLHLYTRRVLSWRAEYGDSRYWRRISAAQLLSA
jgi:alkylation response protein AidB-like acyl-CoA dehydrogenase